MSESNKVEQDRAALAAVEGKGALAKLGTYTRLSGPGWLQSAITLGGGSLAGSLYIGVIGGYDMLWLQPMMMILGIIMLSAIAYVTLSTGEKPFHAINKHINPVLGWGWLTAAMIANLVWAMPQFSLGTGAIQQNLGLNISDELCVVFLFIIAGVVIWFYDAGGWGIKLFEVLLKIMVALIVLAFFGVVASLALKGALPWGKVFAGFIPDFSLLSESSDTIKPFIAGSSNPDYWEKTVVDSQTARMIAAAATAVGINMTFLLPYSMLRKGWDKTFRGLATFDLSTGLFIPFVLATSCVVIAAASQFHAQAPDISAETSYIDMEGGAQGNLETMVAAKDEAGFEKAKAEQEAIDRAVEEGRMDTGDQRLAAFIDANSNMADKQLAVMLIQRDAGALAGSLENVTGSKAIAQYVFGLGVLGMSISTIIILMLINGFTFTEALGVKTSGTMHRIGSYLPAFTGAFGFLFLWGNKEAKFWLAIPTSQIGMILLPVAYISFFLLMNNTKLMGDNKLKGGKAVAANVVMIAAIVAATYGCVKTLLSKTMNIPGTEQSVQPFLIGAAIGFIALVLIAQVVKAMKKRD
ncbi:MAG: divalent metal cation transporter [Phycisphaeraceae bacterium]